MSTQAALGATYLGGQRCRFNVWAPLAERVDVHLSSPQDRLVALERNAQGYHQALVDEVEPGAMYGYVLDGGPERPDPASRCQSRGVHGLSTVVSPTFDWQDQGWFGLPLQQYVIYELHVGTFTPEGTFEAILASLDYLKDVGVTAIEIMPVAQFPGERNWGYDGVYPFAVQDSYGGPTGLKRLVNACHLNGLAVVLDVVYNHLGPEGNYMREFAPYFTDW
jgi:maltooligosyltrehalose trehalohydrolase